MYTLGHFDMWIDNHALFARLKGQWNEEMALSFNGDERAHIVYLDDWELGIPELEPIINDLVAWVINHGLTRTAQVYSPNLLKRYQLDRMIKEKIGDFERRVYPNETAAFAWLASEGVPVTREILINQSA